MLADVIEINCVFFNIVDEEKGTEVREKEEILRILTKKLCLTIGITVYNEILNAVLDREKDRSTGIERGLAVPHCRTKAVTRIHIALAILANGVDWDSLDKKPANFIFLVVGPSDKPEEYLKLLSQISRSMKSDAIRKKLLSAKSVEEVIAILKED